MKLKQLPRGIDDFAKLRTRNCYYVDKTTLIQELLENLGEVNLFTRPRRFGKSLNMSMLKCFFEVGTDKSLFDGLNITKEKELCEQHMGKYPVIYLTLKQVNGNNFEEAKEQMWSIIKEEAVRFDILQESTNLNERDKQDMMNLSMGIGNLNTSLLLMSRILHREYQKKTILLIDEYDVPLQKAHERSYYREMVTFLSNMFGASMKTNPYMEFAVVTGCLRIAKESIFTGFNNVTVHSILNSQYDEYFGFTDAEVWELLNYYGQSNHYDLTKSWYDGYLFGKTYVYCPWDVILWCNKLLTSDDKKPENFWANTSGNDIITRFADSANDKIREELSTLIEGNAIWKSINMELTYDEIYEAPNNLWSLLLMTGYLTVKSYDDEKYLLTVPNREILDLFRKLIRKWFTKKVMQNKLRQQQFYQALDNEDVAGIEHYINILLKESISSWDGGDMDTKETFYHGLLLGVLHGRDDWTTKSNRESGYGRLDIVSYPDAIYIDSHRRAIIMELKYSADGKLERDAKKALEQMKLNDYDSYFAPWNPPVTHFGIAFHKKYCKVLKG